MHDMLPSHWSTEWCGDMVSEMEGAGRAQVGIQMAIWQLEIQCLPKLCCLKGCVEQTMSRYKRDDGLDLTATLYLPPGYDKERDGRLPCILSAYPREFKSKVDPTNAGT